MQVHRFQSPFRHWVSGLLAELAVFSMFLIVAGVLVAVFVHIF